MDNPTIVKTGYNAIAAQYLATRTTNSADVQLLDEFIQRLPPHAMVLDAGCGAGVPITQKLAQHFHVTGVDISEAQIELARKHVLAAQFLCADMTTLDFPNHTFDAICSYYAIIHIPRTEHRSLLQNFYRMVKPAGLALLCLGANDLPDDYDDDYFGARMYWSHYDAKTNIQLLQACGFELIWSRTVRDAAWPTSAHLFVLARKL
jgi:SAM-dependent methyltransferase